MRIHNNTAILYTQKGTRNNYCRLFMGAGGGDIFMRIHNNTAILYTQKGTRNNYCRLFMGAGGTSL